MGATEYGIIDPAQRRMLVLQRLGDLLQGVVVPPGPTYRAHLLPGPEVRTDVMLGEPARRWGL